MDKIRDQFIESLYADEIDSHAYQHHFMALVSDDGFIKKCIHHLNKKPSTEGFSRIGYLLSLVGEKENACKFWEKDIKAKQISWWQYNKYLETIFHLKGKRTACLVADAAIELLADRKNTYATLGMLIKDADPYLALEYFKKDADENRLTSGFKLNYACVLASVGKIKPAVEMVKEAYKENDHLSEGFIRISKAATKLDIETICSLFIQEILHGQRSTELGIAFISLIQKNCGIHPALRTLISWKDNKNIASVYEILIDCSLKKESIYYAEQLLISARVNEILLPEKYLNMEETLEMIKTERTKNQYHFCTVITPDYLSYALAQHESLLRYNENAVLHVLICPNGHEDQSEMHASDSLKFYYSDDLCQAGLSKALSDKYHGKYEDGFRWSMKSVMLTHLLNEVGCEKAIFIDCDIFFFNDYDFLFDELDDCAMLITPHWKPYSEPGKDKIFVYEEFFYNGLFNAGFIGVSKKALAHLDWWARACLFNCYKEINRGYFVDQSHLNILQAHFDDVRILKHRGCNVAHWNERECPRISQEDGEVMIMGKYPVIFCHFALLCPDRYITGADKLLHPHFLEYVQTLKKHGLTRLRTLFTEFSTQLKSLAWLLNASNINEVSCHDTEAAKYLLEKGFKVHSDYSSNNLVIVCDKGMAVEAKSSVKNQYDDKDIFIIERDPVNGDNTEEIILPTPAQRFKGVLAHLLADDLKKIMIYGGGMHTHKLFSEPLNLNDTELICVIDDSPHKQGLNLCGLKILSSNDAKKIAADAIILSSDTIEELLFKKAKKQFPQTPIYRLYGEDNA